jgi:hypothetical protein
MTPPKQTAAEKQRARMMAAATRRTEPDAGPAGKSAVRSKPVRITVDLTPEAYRRLTDWTKYAASDLGFVKLSIADVVRAMVGSLSVEEFEQEMRVALRNLKED